MEDANATKATGETEQTYSEALAAYDAYRLSIRRRVQLAKQITREVTNNIKTRKTTNATVN